MNKIKAAAVSTKNHIARNKFAYAMAGVAVGAIALQQMNVRDFYKFLEEKGIDPVEFYCPEMLEETLAP